MKHNVYLVVDADDRSAGAEDLAALSELPAT